jgi:tetratricopeptide (TPR) repeat protein
VDSVEVLQMAIQAARAGRKVEARDMLMQIVETDPGNEMAWVWLSGLVDSLEDRIIACENALTINPANQKVRSYLEELQRQQKSKVEQRNRAEAGDLLTRAKSHADQNEIDIALRLAEQASEKYSDNEEVWLLIGKLSANLEQQIRALEKAYQLNPSNKETAMALEELRYLKVNPMSAATRLEQSGKMEEALRAYQDAAGKAKNSREFDHIYNQILRIEALQKEKIRYVAPSTSIIRLTFVWPLLYFSLSLVQMGLNPLAHPSVYACLGLPLVGIGSFLLSVAEVRSRHLVWQKLFGEQGDGSQFARLVTAASGWFLIIIPYVLLFLDSLNRLQNFRIPPTPF